jgi:hypothetical protein
MRTILDTVITAQRAARRPTVDVPGLTRVRRDRIRPTSTGYRLVQHADGTPADAAALRTTHAALTEILATPPTGYTLPPTARRLIDHATAHGWQTAARWYPPPGAEHAEVLVEVLVGRRLTPAEAAEDHRGEKWEYTLSWHSRGCQPRRLRLFGQGLAETPADPAVHHAPSVASITAVITAHPGPGVA